MTRRKFKIPKKRREQMRKASRAWRATPRGSFVHHRCNALARGVEWQFDFEGWWRLWESSGKWELRGNRLGFYCMARLGDTGPYAPFNCVIVPWEVNSAGAAVASGFCEESAVKMLPGMDYC